MAAQAGALANALNPGEIIIDQLEQYDTANWDIWFSDGGCHDPEDEAMAVASWSVHSHAGGTYCGPTIGEQSAQAGEVEAAVQAALIAAPGTLLHTDSKYVTDIITKGVGHWAWILGPHA